MKGFSVGVFFGDVCIGDRRHGSHGDKKCCSKIGATASNAAQPQGRPDLRFFA